MDVLNDLIVTEYPNDTNDMKQDNNPYQCMSNIRCDMAHNKDSWTSILSINQLDELSKLSKEEQDTIDKQISDICTQMLRKHNGLVQEQVDDNQAIKYDSEKIRVELLPYNALLEIAKVMTIGATKYGDNNWRKGMLWSRLYGACLRHLIAWYEGQDRDEETGLLHLAHAGCCILFLITYQLLGLGTDNRIVNSNINT